MSRTPARSDLQVSGAHPDARTDEERGVKYVVLIYSNPSIWQSLPPEEADRVIKDHFVIIDELTATGELLASSACPTPRTRRPCESTTESRR